MDNEILALMAGHGNWGEFTPKLILSPPIAYPITEMNASNHLHPAGRWGMLPKTTDGHQFGLVLPQL